MEKLKLKRINGFLYLDEYFIKLLGREYKSEEDLLNNGLIEIENSGISNKFWIMSSDKNNKIALFKEQMLGSNEAYAELFAEEIAKVLNIPTAHYDLAIFNGYEGVISYNFLENKNNDYSGFDLIASFYDKKLETDEELCQLYNIDYYNDSIDEVADKLNNLEDIWIILEDKFKDNPQKTEIVFNIVNGLVDKLIFDILTINNDDHADNWKIVDNKLSPLFDNSNIFGIRTLTTSTYDKIKQKKLLFTVDNSYSNKPLEQLEYFLKISSSEYLDLVKDKVCNLESNIDLIPDRIEQKIEQKVPVNIRDYFINNMHIHLNNVHAILDVFDRGPKK